MQRRIKQSYNVAVSGEIFGHGVESRSSEAPNPLYYHHHPHPKLPKLQITNQVADLTAV